MDLQPEVLYSTKLSFQSKDEIKFWTKSNGVYFLQILSERTTKGWAPAGGKVNPRNGVGYKQ